MTGSTRSLLLTLPLASIGGCGGGKASDHVWVQVVPSVDSVCALDSEGAAFCTEGAPQPDHDSGAYSAISVNGQLGCGIRAADGGIECWGDDAIGLQVPEGGPFARLAVAVGDGFQLAVCAISVNEVLSCSGDSSSGVIFNSTPPGAWVDLALGPNAGIVLSADGQVSCWGTPTWPDCAIHPDGRAVVDIVRGDEGLCVAYDDGGLECVVDNAPDLALFAAPGDYVQVSLGNTFLCARDRGGELGCWGHLPEGGQVEPPPGRFTQIASYGYHSCALGEDSQIVCWGILRLINGLEQIATAYYGPS